MHLFLLTVNVDFTLADSERLAEGAPSFGQLPRGRGAAGGGTTDSSLATATLWLQKLSRICIALISFVWAPALPAPLCARPAPALRSLRSLCDRYCSLSAASGGALCFSFRVRPRPPRRWARPRPFRRVSVRPSCSWAAAAPRLSPWA